MIALIPLAKTAGGIFLLFPLQLKILQSKARAHTVPPVAGPRFAVEATYGMYAARAFEFLSFYFMSFDQIITSFYIEIVVFYLIFCFNDVFSPFDEFRF